MQELPQETRIEDIAFKGKKRAFKARSPRKVMKGTTKKKKKPQRANLVKKLDALMSIYVRNFYADEHGLVQCYTCPNKKPVKQMQNGHYVSRSVRTTRWERTNCRPQCYGCNVMHGGQPITFRENLVKELGEDWVKELEESRHTLFNPSDEWLLDQISIYTDLTKSYTSS